MIYINAFLPNVSIWYFLIFSWRSKGNIGKKRVMKKDLIFFLHCASFREIFSDLLNYTDSALTHSLLLDKSSVNTIANPLVLYEAMTSLEMAMASFPLCHVANIYCFISNFVSVTTTEISRIVESNKPVGDDKVNTIGSYKALGLTADKTFR